MLGVFDCWIVATNPLTHTLEIREKQTVSSMNRSQGPPQTSYGGYNGSRDGRSQGGLSTQSISYGDEKASQANQSFQQQRYSQASKQGLQRGSVGQAPGGSLGPEQARPGQPSKSREDEERRQNIMCFLFLTLGLLAAVIVVMVVLLAVWLTDGDDEVTVLVNATNETESRTQSTNPDPVPVRTTHFTAVQGCRMT